MIHQSHAPLLLPGRPSEGSHLTVSTSLEGLPDCARHVIRSISSHPFESTLCPWMAAAPGAAGATQGLAGVSAVSEFRVTMRGPCSLA